MYICFTKMKHFIVNFVLLVTLLPTGFSTMNIMGPEYGTRQFQPRDRYQETLFQHLLRYVKNDTLFVEITAGTGQLSAYLAAHLPKVTFVPADHDATFLPRMLQYAHETSNLENPFHFDVRKDPYTWFNGVLGEGDVDYIFNSNLVHLAPPECYKGLIRGSSYYLEERGYLFMFGVFKYYNHTSPQCNIDLDETLRKANPLWGLRDVQLELIKEAEKHKLYLVVIHYFPFHQQLLVFKKGSRLLC